MTLSAEDRLDLLDLYSLSTRLIGDGDIDGWVDLFTPDGVFSMSAIEQFDAPAMEIRGAEALRGYISDVISGAFDAQIGLQPGVKKRYLTTNVLLTEGDQGSATGTAYLLMIVLDPAPRLLASGVYEDTFVKLPAGWRISHRRLTPDA